MLGCAGLWLWPHVGRHCALWRDMNSVSLVKLTWEHDVAERGQWVHL